MAYARGYRLKFTNVEESTIYVDIYDTSTEDELVSETEWTDLQGSGSPLRITIVDNDENKFNPIRGKQATIKFLSTSTINLNTFLGGEDDRWLVYAYIKTGDDPQVSLFKGHLVLADLDQDFLDDDTNCEVTLIASDGLGLLKEVSLVNPDGENPRGKYKIIEYISWCLKKTNLESPIYVNHSLYGEDTPGVPFYESHYLDAKSFEEEIGESVDCYTALQMILGYDSFLTQWKGDWWIVRIEEQDHLDRIVHLFDSDGVYQSTLPPTQYPQTIGGDEDIYLVHETTRVKATRPHKHTTLTYPYNFPLEIVDNIDFSRGDLFATISPTEKRFHVDDWTIGRYSRGSEVPAATTVGSYITRLYEGDYEKERYLSVGYSTEAFPYTYLRSNPIPLGAKDKAIISIDYKFSTTDVGDDPIVFGFLLKGDDGVYYEANSNDDSWVVAIPGPDNLAFGGTSYTSDEQKIEWRTASYTTGPAPVAGNMYVFLMAGYDHAGSGDPIKYYQNFNFNYIPFINGSYQKYRGQHNKVSQVGEYRAKVDEDVSVSDSPRPLFKGGLFKNGVWEGLGLKTVDYSGTDVQISGDVSAQLTPGTRFRTNPFGGTSVNTGVFTVISSSFSAGVTTVLVNESTVDESPAISTLEYLLLGTFTLADRFYAGNLFGSTLPSDENLHPYGYHQAFGVWNQNNRILRLFDVTCQGLRTPGYDVPDSIHKFSLEPIEGARESHHARSKFFLLLHYDMDFYTCEWSGTICEVYDNLLGKTYTDPLEFKYISDKSN